MDKGDHKRKRKALQMKRYRAKLATDAEKYEQVKLKDRQRKKNEYRKKKEEINKNKKELAEYHKKKAEKQKSYRKRKEKENSAKKVQQHKGTEHKIKKKKQCLKKETLELRKKSIADNTKRWRMRVKLAETSPSTSNPPKNSQGTPFSSRTTEWRAIKKVKANLPTTPAKKATIIEKLASSLTSEKILQDRGVFMIPEARNSAEIGEILIGSLASSIEDCKPRDGVKARQKLSYDALTSVFSGKVLKRGHKKQVSSSLKMSKKILKKSKGWANKSRKQRKDRIADEVRQSVKDFYLLSTVSRISPNKKDVVKVKHSNGTERLQKQVMTMKVHDAYDLYKETHPGIKISLTTFRMLKPQNVRHMCDTNRKSCLCTTCCNLSLKAEALQKFLTREKCADSDLPITKQDLSSASMCKGGELSADCINRECSSCGTKTLRDVYKTILQQKGESKLNWYQWQYVSMEKDGQIKRCISCVQQETSFDEFLGQVIGDLEKYTSHAFRAQWQADQMKECIKNLQDCEVVMVMDYSENYSCRYQNEVQSAFWDQVQVTIHPVMTYYWKMDRAERVLVKHSIIFISNDTKHDSDAVHVFENRVMQVLEEANVAVHKIHQFTDGCAAQYKGCKAFSDISHNTITTIRNNFETSHGKSVCDGLGAIVKSACHRAVLSGKAVISDAPTLYRFCKDHLQHDLKTTVSYQDGEKIESTSIREFLYVDRATVRYETGSCSKRNGPAIPPSAQTP